jgi:hypothetical protein
MIGFWGCFSKWDFKRQSLSGAGKTPHESVALDKPGAGEALSPLGLNPCVFDLVITDPTMPGITGKNLSKRFWP